MIAMNLKPIWASDKCKDLIYSVSEKILGNNPNNRVALDFGFWKRQERSAVDERFKTHGHTVSKVNFPIAYDAQIDFMKKRQDSAIDAHYVFDEGIVEFLNRLFEEPDPLEGNTTKDAYLRSIKSAE
jgi:predicted kinase